MPNQQPGINRIFYALSDSTRMAVLARLSEGPAAVGELAAPFGMALPSFTQHLGILEDCGLVSSRKEGRMRIYEITPAPLRAAEQWLEQRRHLWETRLDQLDIYLKTLSADQ